MIKRLTWLKYLCQLFRLEYVNTFHNLQTADPYYFLIIIYFQRESMFEEFFNPIPRKLIP